jgi:hypothetical protein
MDEASYGWQASELLSPAKAVHRSAQPSISKVSFGWQANVTLANITERSTQRAMREGCPP